MMFRFVQNVGTVQPSKQLCRLLPELQNCFMWPINSFRWGLNWNCFVLNSVSKKTCSRIDLVRLLVKCIIFLRTEQVLLAIETTTEWIELFYWGQQACTALRRLRFEIANGLRAPRYKVRRAKLEKDSTWKYVEMFRLSRCNRHRRGIDYTAAQKKVSHKSKT